MRREECSFTSYAMMDRRPFGLWILGLLKSTVQTQQLSWLGGRIHQFWFLRCSQISTTNGAGRYLRRLRASRHYRATPSVSLQLQKMRQDTGRKTINVAQATRIGVANHVFTQ